MTRPSALRIAVAALLAMSLTAGVGCDTRMLGSNTGALLTGWLLGSFTTAGNVEQVCYENGVLIDCADLPADLGE